MDLSLLYGEVRDVIEIWTNEMKNCRFEPEPMKHVILPGSKHVTDESSLLDTAPELLKSVSHDEYDESMEIPSTIESNKEVASTQPNAMEPLPVSLITPSTESPNDLIYKEVCSLSLYIFYINSLFLSHLDWLPT